MVWFGWYGDQMVKYGGAFFILSEGRPLKWRLVMRLYALKKYPSFWGVDLIVVNLLLTSTIPFGGVDILQ
jgi:hypothetical protein